MVRYNAINPEQLSRVLAFKGHFFFGDEARVLSADIPRTYITVLRNPVERVLSSYEFFSKHVWEESSDISIEDFLNGHYIIGTNHMTRVLAGTNNPNDIDKALTNLEKFDIVGTVEDLPGFKSKLERLLSWSKKHVIVPQNASNRLHREDLTDRQFSLLVKQNENDFVLYNEVINHYC
jgi:hypothetical protein